MMIQLDGRKITSEQSKIEVALAKRILASAYAKKDFGDKMTSGAEFTRENLKKVIANGGFSANYLKKFFPYLIKWWFWFNERSGLAEPKIPKHLMIYCEKYLPTIKVRSHTRRRVAA